MKWLKPLADKNDARAMWKLGSFTLAGRGAKPDVKEAQKWINKAEARGLALAQVELGRMQYYGLGGPHNYKKAYDWCERASKKIKKEAEAGDPEAALAYGWMLTTGMGVYEMDPPKAVELWKKAAEAGYGPAADLLANHLITGKEKDKTAREEARKWYQFAADLGYAEAQFNLYEMYAVGNPVWYPKGGEKDGDANPDAGWPWLKKAADQGHARALFFTGSRHYRGEQCPKNPQEALRLYQAALKTATGRTLSLVQSQMGVMYEEGQGVPKDLKEAQKWYQAIADRGDVLGYTALGTMNYGQGNLLEAVKWWKLAAAQREMMAMNNLGASYAQGKGIKKDLEEALRWFLMAAQSGNPQAIANLQQCQKDLAAERAKGPKK
jgi:TPR repeat protein